MFDSPLFSQELVLALLNWPVKAKIFKDQFYELKLTRGSVALLGRAGDPSKVAPTKKSLQWMQPLVK